MGNTYFTNNNKNKLSFYFYTMYKSNPINSQIITYIHASCENKMENLGVGQRCLYF